MINSTKKNTLKRLFNISLIIFLVLFSQLNQGVLAQKIDTLYLNPNDDASISNRSDFINSNFMNVTFERLSGWTGNNVGSNEQDWRALMKFNNLTNFQGKNIISAKLILHHDSRYPYQEIGDFSFKLYPVTANWSSSTVTWNTQPGFDASAGVAVAARANISNYDSLSIDITALVNAIASGQKTNYGFLLKLNNEDPYNSINFASADNDSARLRPTLIIKYNDANCNTWQPDSAGIDAAINDRNDLVNYNFGNSSFLQVVGWSGNNVNSPQQNIRSLFKFTSLDHLGSNIAVDSAFLTLHYPTDYPYSLPITQDNSGKIYLIKDNWSENAVTWSNQPSIDTSIYINTPSVASYDSLTFNITHLVKEIVENGKPNYGFLFKINNETPYHSLNFASSDHPTVQWRPKLKVCKRTASSKVTANTYYSPVSSADDIKLYPNPATSEQLFIETSISYTTLKVYSAEGNLMYQSNGLVDRIGLSQLIPGMYSIVFNTGSGTKVKKFIKN